MMRGMAIDMNDAQLHALEQLRAYLNGTVAVGCSVDANERYDFITRTYTDADMLLLAHTDTLHGTLSGPATKQLMERARE